MNVWAQAAGGERPFRECSVGSGAGPVYRFVDRSEREGTRAAHDAKGDR